MKKTYLVTGGTGFIGSNLVRRLVERGGNVRVLDNGFRGRENRLSDVSGKVEMLESDIRDYAGVERACKGVDCVFHLASVNGTGFFYSMPETVLSVAVKGTVNVIEACIACSVGELFFASSSEVYQSPPGIPTGENVPLSIPDPMNPRFSYAGGKLIGELLVLNYGRKFFERVVVFRPHNVYGPDMGWEHVIPQLAVKIKQIGASGPKGKISLPIQGKGNETRAFVFIEDFIDGLMLLEDKGRHLEIYNIGTSEEVPVKELVSLIGDFYGKKVDIISGRLAEGSTLRRCPDVTKLKSLGYSPGYSLERGLQKTLEWYAEAKQGGDDKNGQKNGGSDE